MSEGETATIGLNPYRRPPSVGEPALGIGGDADSARGGSA
jgi:hypothetical protein